MKLFYYLVLSVVLSGCGVAMSSMKPQRNIQHDLVDLLDYSEISEDDELLLATIGLNATNVAFGDRGVGINLIYHPIRLGEFSCEYNLPLYFARSDFFDPNYLVNQVSKHEFRLNYSLPILRNNVTKLRPISSLNEKEESYYIITRSKSINKGNIRVGVKQNYCRTYSEEYVNVAKMNTDLTIFGADFDMVNQSVISFNLGGSYQMCMNTNITAKDRNKREYVGRSSRVTSFFFDLNVLINSSVDLTEHEFRDKSNGQWDEYSRFVSPKEYLVKQVIGFSIGLDNTTSYLKHKSTLFTYGIELGTQPGYYSSLKESFFGKLAVKVGLGLWR